MEAAAVAASAARLIGRRQREAWPRAMKRADRFGLFAAVRCAPAR